MHTSFRVFLFILFSWIKLRLNKNNKHAMFSKIYTHYCKQLEKALEFSCFYTCFDKYATNIFFSEQFLWTYFVSIIKDFIMKGNFLYLSLAFMMHCGKIFIFFPHFFMPSLVLCDIKIFLGNYLVKFPFCKEIILRGIFLKL